MRAITFSVVSSFWVFTLERTLSFFRDRKVDAVMICGDLADWGLLSGLKYIAETWEKVFPRGKGAGGYTIVMTNDGVQPQRDIREGGGISNLRSMAEALGGSLWIESRPEFKMTIFLPLDEEQRG